MGVEAQYCLDEAVKAKTLKMKLNLSFLFLLVVYATAQDTYYCPDGWVLHEPDEGNPCECFLFASNYARVNHADAGSVCASHGGFLAEVADGPNDNYWIVSQLIDRHTKKMLETDALDSDNLGGPHWDDQWWIGAKSYTKHDEHQPGEWIWEHSNTTVEWFDWAPGEPNDYHRQQCMTYLRYDYGNDLFYNWNDWDCNDQADYICQKDCPMY